jgi:hypothetical protein
LLAISRVISLTNFLFSNGIFAYKGMLKLFSEKQSVIDGSLEIKETGISTNRFEKLYSVNSFKIIKQIKYLVAPI